MPPAVSVSEELIALFKATTASTEERPDPRAILVHNEQNNTVLTKTASVPPDNADSADFAPVLRKLLADQPNRSAYILFRLDSTAASGMWEWLLCCYQPPAAPIKEKMRYSQTKAALHQALGDLSFLDVIYGQTVSEFHWPTKVSSRRKNDYQNPNVGAQGRPASQAAGASTGGVRRNFGQVGKTPVPGSMPTSAPVPASAAKVTKSYAGAAPTPFSGTNPTPAATTAAVPAPTPVIAEAEQKEPVKEQAQPEVPVAEERAEQASTPSGIPLPKMALQAAELSELNDDDDDDWDGPAALQDSRVPSPVQVGHVAEAPKLDTVDEELAAKAADAGQQQEQLEQGSAGVPADALQEALAAEKEKAETPVAETPAKEDAPVSSVPEVAETEATISPDPSAVERPQEPIAAVLEESAPDPIAAEAIEQADAAPLDTSNGVIASTETRTEEEEPSSSVVPPETPGSDTASLIVEPPTPAPLRAEPDIPEPEPELESESGLAETAALRDDVPVLDTAAVEALNEQSGSLLAPAGPGSDSASIIVEPPTPMPARAELGVSTPRAVFSPLASPPLEPLPPPSAITTSTVTESAATPPAAPAGAPSTSSGPISVSGYGTKQSDSLLTEAEATRAEVNRATAAERSLFAPPAGGGLGPGHTVLSFEWEEEVELAAPPRFLPAAEVGLALAKENGPRYALYRLEGRPIFADDDGGADLNAGHGRRSSTPIATTGGGLLFIYSCPSSSSVRERMLYSTNLRSFHQLAEQRVAGLKVHKRVETSDPEELTASFLASELDRVLGASGKESETGAGNGAAAAAGASGPSPLLTSTQAFARPKRPGGRR
ncbi:unnamed protein product [Tilletia caries]|nr:unnamed protein product [Tilletia caries]